MAGGQPDESGCWSHGGVPPFGCRSPWSPGCPGKPGRRHATDRCCEHLHPGHSASQPLLCLAAPSEPEPDGPRGFAPPQTYHLVNRSRGSDPTAWAGPVRGLTGRCVPRRTHRLRPVLRPRVGWHTVGHGVGRRRAQPQSCVCCLVRPCEGMARGPASALRARLRLETASRLAGVAACGTVDARRSLAGFSGVLAQLPAKGRTGQRRWPDAL